MKSYGGIIEQATSYSNLYESFDYVLRGTMRKTCPTGQKLLAHREEVIAQLQRELRVGGFTGILMHNGMTADHSYGCILLGKNNKVGRLDGNRIYMDALAARVMAAEKLGERIKVEVL